VHIYYVSNNNESRVASMAKWVCEREKEKGGEGRGRGRKWDVDDAVCSWCPATLSSFLCRFKWQSTVTLDDNNVNDAMLAVLLHIWLGNTHTQTHTHAHTHIQDFKFEHKKLRSNFLNVSDTIIAKGTWTLCVCVCVCVLCMSVQI